MTQNNFLPQIESLDFSQATNAASHTIHTQQLKRWKDEKPVQELIVLALTEYADRVARLDEIYMLLQKDVEEYRSAEGCLHGKNDKHSSWLLRSLNMCRQECDEAYRYLVLITNVVISKDADPQAWTSFVEKVNEDIRYHRQHTIVNHASPEE